MCNFRHNDSKTPKNKNGTGYKVFYYDNDAKQNLGLFSFVKYSHSKNEWIDWHKYLHDRTYDRPSFGDGFCFFFNKKEAIRFFNLVSNWLNRHNLNRRNGKYILLKIEYKDAFARHMEKNIDSINHFDMGLCKSFKMTKEVIRERFTKH
jgi:hypothetical protein